MHTPGQRSGTPVTLDEGRSVALCWGYPSGTGQGTSWGTEDRYPGGSGSS